MMKVFTLAIALALAACGGIHVDGDDEGDGAGSDGGGSAADSGTGGGGGGGDGPFIAKSGTRIKMNVLTTPDGAKSFQGWRDTELDVDCYFGPASDGVTRCIPSSPPGLVVGFYANDSCTGVQLAYETASCPDVPASSYVAQFGYVDGCTANYRWTIYEGVTDYDGPVWNGTPGNCETINLPGYSFYTLGPVVPPSSFQSGTVAIE